jgi:Gluconate 2-dehydrogenase subunit 3
MAKIELPVLTSEGGLGRRQWLQGLVGGVGAGLVAIPGLAQTHPIHAHLADPATVAAADAKSAAAGWKPEFLDLYQFETLSSLCERILPGAVKLKADRFIDELLSVDTSENQQAFLSALGGIDGEARARYAKPWKALTEAQQIELLTAASTAAAPEDAGGRDLRARNAPAAPSDAAGGSLRGHFEHLKGWVVGSYYSSEAGMRELGFTGNQFYPSFPGCEHPDGHK